MCADSQRVGGGNLRPESLGALIFGVTFVLISLVLAVLYPEPSPFTYFVFRVVLSLACASVSVVLPDLLRVQLILGIRIGCAALVFASIYFLNPAQLISEGINKRRLDDEINFRISKINEEICTVEQVAALYRSNRPLDPKRLEELDKGMYDAFEQAYHRVGFYFVGRVTLPPEYFVEHPPTIKNPEFQDMDFVTIVNQRWRLVHADTPIDSSAKTLLADTQKLIASMKVAADPFVTRGPENALTATRYMRKFLREIATHELIKPVLLKPCTCDSNAGDFNKKDPPIGGGPPVAKQSSTMNRIAPYGIQTFFLSQLFVETKGSSQAQAMLKNRRRTKRPAISSAINIAPGIAPAATAVPGVSS